MFEHQPENTFNTTLLSASKNQDCAPVPPRRRSNETPLPQLASQYSASTPAPSMAQNKQSTPQEQSPMDFVNQAAIDGPGSDIGEHKSSVDGSRFLANISGNRVERVPASSSPNSSRLGAANENVDGRLQDSDPFPPVKLKSQSPQHFPDLGAKSVEPSNMGLPPHNRGDEELPSATIKTEGSVSPAPETPFNPSQVFTQDISQDVEGDIVVKTAHRYINEIIDSQRPEILEKGVEKALEVLVSLKNTFTRHLANSTDAAAWIDAIQKLQDQAERERARTVIGVVGNTGAGKSSVINAMLDEERLVPTNCMRACTAVVTSISNNTSDDLNFKYRAEVQFIELTDWEKELRILLTEFLSEQGTLSSETRDPNSDAGIAWSKFRAVYPHIHKDRLSDWTVEKLMTEKTVLECLGTTKNLRSAFPDQFYKQLQKYVDSKEKSTGKKDKKEKEKTKNAPPAIEYWPLIKEVRIYTKAKALETGAVIVDLPGVHDSNAARAAVAERYMKQCTELWIVTPITRAVDDKAAKNLLGDTFKRQLKYDGNYSNVTFICSKTDDISITEATDSLDLHNEISTLEDKERGYRSEVDDVKKKMDQLKDSIEVYKDVMDSCDVELETWEDLKDRAEDGETVFAPPQKKSRKRKGYRMNKGASKRRQADDSDAEYISSGDDKPTESSDPEGESDDEGVEAPMTPLSLERIKQKIDELRQSKKRARQEKAVIVSQLPDSKKTIRNLEEQIKKIRGEMTALCIAGRNAYSKGAIQQDFAAGIRELDMENAEEEDEENFNPDEDRRDYDEVARSLPVFCVSSRAYQKMSGRLRKDADVPGFVAPEETEVPQLQEHCKQLTVAVRIQSCRKFFFNFVSQLTTFALWASNNGTGLNMTDDDRSKQRKHLQRRLDELETGFEHAVTACVSTMKKELRSQIFGQYPKLIEEAIRDAPEIAHRWGYKHEGGLLYATYKAVCRRAGAYHSATAGHRDFNGELTDPIVKSLAGGWERAFQNRLPKVLTEYTDASCTILHKFHETIEGHAQLNGTSLATLSLLQGSINTCTRMLRDNISQYLEHITQAQREANREFVPQITSFMEYAYIKCTAECGTGSYMRMKGHMESHVDKARYKMFTAAAETVEMALNNMCKTLEEKLLDNADEIIASVRAAYLHALSGVPVPSQDEMASKGARELRNQIIALLNGLDDEFEPIAQGHEREHDTILDDMPDGTQDDDANDDVATEAEGDEEVNGTSRGEDNDTEEESMQRFRNHVDGSWGFSGGATRPSSVGSTTTPDRDMLGTA